ncbi:major facilitator superfamily protein [Kipferlia bialata]|uniref:Lysosomal dipeptide transporter MFSD1 n=1 Tax=Kipferlia bialata TaxID=797122 RepID=A0A9K3GKE9_9EUKA|nr:major facilitator superfamily protein [Kipferlia bialata]|eukprot:g7244.t1
MEEILKITYIGSIFYGLCAIQYILTGFHRAAGSVLSTFMMEDLGISATQMSMVSSSFFYIYAVMQPVAGILADRLGPRLVLGLFSIVAATGAVLVGNAHSFTTLFTGRILVGLGGSLVAVPCYKVITIYFSPNVLSRLMGIQVAVGGVGGLLSTAPLEWMSAKWSWRTAVFVSAVATLVDAVLILVFLRDDPEDLGLERPWLNPMPVLQERKGHESLSVVNSNSHTVSQEMPIQEEDTSCSCSLEEECMSKDLNTQTLALSEPEVMNPEEEVTCEDGVLPVMANILKESRFWIPTIAETLAYGQFMTITGLTAKRYLIDAAGYPSADAATMTLAFAVATILSGPGFSMMAYVVSRRTIMCTCSTLGAVFCFLMGFLPTRLSDVAMLATLFGYGCVSGGAIAVFYPVIKERFPGELYAGTTVGLANGLLFIGSALSQFPAGLFLENESAVTGHRNVFLMAGLMSLTASVLFSRMGDPGPLPKPVTSNCIPSQTPLSPSRTSEDASDVSTDEEDTCV